MKEIILTEQGATAFVVYLIRRYLSEHDNDVPAMAREFGVAKDTIWCILRGKVRIPVRHFLPALLNYYGIPVGFELWSAEGFRKKRKTCVMALDWDAIEQISGLVCTLMDDAGLNMYSMSKFTGINRTTIKSIISGDHFPRSETLKSILRPFGYKCMLKVRFHDDIPHKIYKDVQAAVMSTMLNGH